MMFSENMAPKRDRRETSPENSEVGGDSDGKTQDQICSNQTDADDEWIGTSWSIVFPCRKILKVPMRHFKYWDPKGACMIFFIQASSKSWSIPFEIE